MRAKNNLLLIAFVAIILPALSSCFSPYRGDGGNLVIRFGESGNRAVSPTTRSAFNHTITVSGGPGETQVKKNVYYGDTVSFSVAPGEWTINVKAYLGGVLRATGDETRNITGGRNSVDIGMTALDSGLYKKVDGKYTRDNINTALSDALIYAADNPGTYVYLVDPDDTEISQPITLNPASPGLDLTLQSYDTDEPIILRTALEGSMFTVNARAALTLDNVSLEGYSSNRTPLVTVSGGNLTMKDGAKISGNLNTNNPDVNGGGVSVTNNGTFDMKGGEIFGNRVGGLGGGVYVSGGFFTKTGGTIYGSNESEGIKNTASGDTKGHAVYVAGDGSDPVKYRDNTAGPLVRLDSSDDANDPDWNDALIPIRSKTDLDAIYNGPANLTDDYVLVAENIDLSGSSYSASIFRGEFTGTFDGGGNTITGLSMGTSIVTGLAGLFGTVGTGAEVKNLILRDVSVSAGKDASNNDLSQAGGIAGINRGTISGCHVFVDTDKKIVGNGHYVGGIAGENYGTIAACSVQGNIEATASTAGGITGMNRGDGEVQNCSYQGEVKAIEVYAGGIVGYNSGIIANCYAANGTVASSNRVGGIAGHHERGIIANCVALFATIDWDVGANPSYRGRIAGSALSNSMAKNYGLTDMEKHTTPFNRVQTGVVGPSTKNGDHVALVTAKTPSWWNAIQWDTTNGTRWKFDGDSPWERGEDQLPKLKLRNAP